jgi:hypothetical protein
MATFNRAANPLLYLVGDYPHPDLGGYKNWSEGVMVLYLADLDCGLPDTVKVLNSIQVVYECPHELPWYAQVWPHRPVADAGQESETATQAITFVHATGEPGVCWGHATPVWGTASYAMPCRYSDFAYFQNVASPAFDVSLRFEFGMTPMRLVSVSLRWNPEKPEWRQTGVLR